MVELPVSEPGPGQAGGGAFAPESALIGLGSNLGDRARALDRAVERLGAAKGMKVRSVPANTPGSRSAAWRVTW